MLIILVGKSMFQLLRYCMKAACVFVQQGVIGVGKQDFSIYEEKGQSSESGGGLK